MNSVEQDIELLARAIMAEARDEAEQLQAEAKEKADAIRKRAQQEAESERNAILARAREEADRLRSQTSATSQLRTRSMVLEQRENILNEVFEEARKKMSSVKDRSEYGEIAMNLAREALEQLNATEAEVQADGSTQGVLSLDDLSREFTGEFKFGDKLEEGTGVVVKAAGGRLYYDNTLETRLSRLKSSLRAPVYKVLMGEDV